MANYRISSNDVYGIAPTVSSRMCRTRFRAVLDDRQRNNMIGETASKLSTHPIASRNDQRNVYITDTASYVCVDSRRSQSRYSSSSAVSYGAAPTHMTDMYRGRPLRSQVDFVGATASVTSLSTQARTAATTTTQYSAYSQIQSYPSTQANTANTPRTPVTTKSYKYVTPETTSSQVTIPLSYQNHYQQEIPTNYYNDDTTTPMGIGEATIDLISNAGSSFWTLGRELVQGKWAY